MGAIAPSLLAPGELRKQFGELCVAVLIDETSNGVAAGSAALADDRESRGTNVRQCKGAISRQWFRHCCAAEESRRKATKRTGYGAVFLEVERRQSALARLETMRGAGCSLAHHTDLKSALGPNQAAYGFQPFS